MAYIQARKHAHPLRRTQTAAAAVAALTLPVAAQAQQVATPAAAASAAARNAVLPEVKVKSAAEVPYKAETMSSPKFTQPLIDTPQTITVIKKELLREQGATTLAEALRNTPGITMLAGENGNTSSGDSIFMRGFDTQGSIFVDGIRDLGSISRDVFNTEQVEVVKGPSGADNGRGASSGYVNLSTKVPFLDDYNAASVSVGTHDRRRATVDLNQPVDFGIPGTAVRLNLMAQDYGVPGRHEIKKKSYAFAPSIAFGLNTPTRVYFYLLHSEQNNRPDGGVPTVGLKSYYNATAAINNAPKVNSQNFYGAKSDDEDVDINMFTVRLEHDLAPGVTLRNTSRYGRLNLESTLTGVNTITAPTPSNLASYQVSRSRQGRDQENEILTNQTNLSAELGSGTFKHSLSGGVEFIYEKQTTPTFAVPTATPQGNANLYNPSTDDVFQTPVRNGAFSNGDTTSMALYLSDTLKVGEQWQFTAGLRVEHYDTDSQSATVTSNVLQPAVSLDTNGNLKSWKLGALYKPAPNGSIYVSTANSQQPPGGANFALSTAANSSNRPNLDPQEGRNVELGSKWEFNGGLLAVTGALFQSTNKNELVQDPTDTAVYTPVGKRRVRGAEISLVGQVTDALQLSTGMAYMKTKILRAAATTQGGVIANSPKFTWTTWATYKLPAGVTLGGGLRHNSSAVTTSNIPTSTPITGAYRIPSYWVADALVGYEVNKTLSLQLNLNNLFDKHYIASINNGRSRYFPGVPRSALLTANMVF